MWSISQEPSPGHNRVELIPQGPPTDWLGNLILLYIMVKDALEDFSVSAVPGGEGGSPGGRPGERHGGPHHVGHQEDKEVRRLKVLIAIDKPESIPKSK